MPPDFELLIKPEGKPNVDFTPRNRLMSYQLPVVGPRASGWFWNIYPSHGEVVNYDNNSEEFSLLGRWLLKAPYYNIRDLISLYAKLDFLSGSFANPEDDHLQGDSKEYRFRLVSLEPVAYDALSAPTEFTEFKLIAGGNFMRLNDATALNVCHSAISAFTAGKMRLDEYKAWESSIS